MRLYKVLIVDENTNLINKLTEALDSLQYAVFAAKDSKEAEEILLNERIHLLISYHGELAKEEWLLFEKARELQSGIEIVVLPFEYFTGGPAQDLGKTHLYKFIIEQQAAIHSKKIPGGDFRDSARGETLSPRREEPDWAILVTGEGPRRGEGLFP